MEDTAVATLHQPLKDLYHKVRFFLLHSFRPSLNANARVRVGNVCERGVCTRACARVLAKWISREGTREAERDEGKGGGRCVRKARKEKRMCLCAYFSGCH